MKQITIDVFSDLVCPWCFIGARRLETALASLPALPAPVEVKIQYHAFLLDPATPEEGENLADRLQRRYGRDPKQMFAVVESAARESGLTLDFTKVKNTYQTLKGHTLIRHAAQKGTQKALTEALFKAYFLEGRNINSVTELTAIATQHGFTAQEVETLLSNPAELELTRAEARQATEQGITGVPFYVFDGKFAISGGQPPAVFQTALKKALEAQLDA
ncbi:MAG TPA: DsbA family oxidoreductase [Myxococcaceae bacterium]|jgi:predicted DsbA family dithiol-disulfide isomerase